MEKTKIIIDTDIGDDADDALAITLALKSPELEVVGITTVYRNVGCRAKITAQLLRLLDRLDVPIYAGIGTPLIEPADVNDIPCQFLSGMEDLNYCKNKNAIDYLYETLMDSVGDITIVPIGPLTNIAILFIKHPEVKTKIKEIVMMGGAFYMHYNEWNMKCDPEAASIVLNSGVKIRAIGLDVTTQCPVTEEIYQEFVNRDTPITDLLAELLMCYKNRRGRHTFLHDPMAIYAVYDTDMISYCAEDIEVELHGQLTRGTTFNRYRLGGSKDRENVLCAKTIKAQEFVEKFRDIMLA